jgi:hypothetical protein
MFLEQFAISRTVKERTAHIVFDRNSWQVSTSTQMPTLESASTAFGTGQGRDLIWKIF